MKPSSSDSLAFKTIRSHAMQSLFVPSRVLVSVDIKELWLFLGFANDLSSAKNLKDYISHSHHSVGFFLTYPS